MSTYLKYNGIPDFSLLLDSSVAYFIFLYCFVVCFFEVEILAKPHVNTKKTRKVHKTIFNFLLLTLFLTGFLLVGLFSICNFALSFDLREVVSFLISVGYFVEKSGFTTIFSGKYKFIHVFMVF